MSTLGRLLLATLVAAGLGLLLPRPVVACGPYPVTEHSPTGIAGCAVYGDGTASRWGGPGVAVNSCVYPWRTCQPIRITARTTGMSIVVQPTMFCDCYTGTADQRLVDLDPASLSALGLNFADGLYPVHVEPYSEPTLPDTRMAP